MALDGDLAAKCTGVPSMLCDLHLLHLLSQRGTISESLESDGFCHDQKTWGCPNDE